MRIETTRLSSIHSKYCVPNKMLTIPPNFQYYEISIIRNRIIIVFIFQLKTGHYNTNEIINDHIARRSLVYYNQANE